MDQFAILIHELSTLIDVPLHLDHHRCCCLYVNNEMHVQIKEEENKHRLLVSTFIGELPPGKFREILLKEALKENNLFPRIGTCCYSLRNNQFAFFTYVPMQELKGETFADALELFLDRSFSWKTALDTGQIPPRGANLQKTGSKVIYP